MVHWLKVPGALQHGPPSQASAPFLIPSPHLVTTVMVPVIDPVIDEDRVRDAVPDPDMVAVKDPVMVLVNEVVMVPDPVPVIV